MTTKGLAETRTRQRILEAAIQLFSARGFKHVTVREICREANANVAAVNYHFHGKLDLYGEVLEAAVRLVRDVTDEARRAGEGRSAEDKLRAYIRVHCQRMYAFHGSSWLQQLMHREMNDPTAGFTTLLERALRPRFEYLATIVGELLGPRADEQRITQCTVSVHAQILMFRPSPVVDRLPRRTRKAFDVARVVEHITAFSMAGFEAYGRVRQVRRVREVRRVTGTR